MARPKRVFTPGGVPIHSITIHMFDDMVETIEFKCNNEVINTIVGDGNRQGECICGRDFSTIGDYKNKIILGGLTDGNKIH